MNYPADAAVVRLDTGADEGAVAPPDTSKAFTYLLNRWDALNLYCSNGWAEIVNNIAEHSLHWAGKNSCLQVQMRAESGQLFRTRGSVPADG